MFDTRLLRAVSRQIAGAQTHIGAVPRWRHHFAVFWDVFLVIAFGAGLFDAMYPGGLLNARGLWLTLLTLAFLTAHRWLWAPVRHGTGAWPPLYRDLLLVLIVELILVIALLPSSAWFACPLLAMMGQVVAVLPPRRWWLPFAAIALVLAGPIGLYQTLATRQWTVAAGLVAVVAWLVAIFLYIRLQFDQRHERDELTRDLAAAHDELERVAPLLARMDEFHAREQAVMALRDSLQHTLALMNLRLESARQHLISAPDTCAGDLAELHALVQQRLADVARWPAAPEPVPATGIPAAPDAPATPPAATVAEHMDATDASPAMDDPGQEHAGETTEAGGAAAAEISGQPVIDDHKEQSCRTTP